MIKILTVLHILCMVVELKAPNKGLAGKPVPKADVLDDLLSKFMDKAEYTGAVFNYIKGHAPDDHADNLDIAVLDADNVKKLINRAKNKYQHVYRRNPAWKVGTQESRNMMDIALDMMKQSIYATRERLQETRRFRKKYANDIAFNVALFYGALMQITLKIEALYTSMIKLTLPDTHFLWFLIIYEKILAANVDAHDMVERIWYLHDLTLKHREPGATIVIAPTIPIPMMTTTRQRRSRTTTRRRRRTTVTTTLNDTDTNSTDSFLDDDNSTTTFLPTPEDNSTTTVQNQTDVDSNTTEPTPPI